MPDISELENPDEYNYILYASTAIDNWMRYYTIIDRNAGFDPDEEVNGVLDRLEDLYGKLAESSQKIHARIVTDMKHVAEGSPGLEHPTGYVINLWGLMKDEIDDLLRATYKIKSVNERGGASYTLGDAKYSLLRARASRDAPFRVPKGDVFEHPKNFCHDPLNEAAFEEYQALLRAVESLENCQVVMKDLWL